MIIRGVEESTIRQAARAVGVDLYNVHEVSRNAWSFRLVPNGEKFRARNPETNRRKWAVCPHGYYEYIWKVFCLAPKARVRTCRATYTIENFAGKAAYVCGYMDCVCTCNAEQYRQPPTTRYNFTSDIQE